MTPPKKQPRTTKKSVNLTPLSKYLVFTDKCLNRLFHIYEINNGQKYDFCHCLDFPSNSDGVYIFIHENPHGIDDEKIRIMNWEGLYCGKTIDLRRRFTTHQRKDDLKDIDNLHIAICYCSNRQEITQLEEYLLSKYKFPVNRKDNHGIKDAYFTDENV